MAWRAIGVTAANLALILLLATAPGATAPQASPPRDAVAAVAGTGALSGTVMADDTKTPARGARVVLTGGVLPSDETEVTDDAGRFAFTALPAGTFRLSASKPAYLDAIYGQKSPG